MTDTDFIHAMQQGLPPIAAPIGTCDLERNLNEIRNTALSNLVAGLAVTEYRMDGLLLGNADIEMNNHEAIHGICAQGEGE